MKFKKILKLICIALIFVFLCSYFIEMSGYYEYNLQSKKNLTQTQMEQFEADINEGKDVDLNQYLKETTIDYSNKITRTTTEASIKLNDYLKNFLTNGLKMLGQLVN